MRITKYTHACVRLEHEGRVLVLDPGIWSEPAALAGAGAVLVTHEHADHVDELRLAGLGVPVHAPAGADLRVLAGTGPVHEATPGRAFTAAGFRIRPVGGRHAAVHDDRPECAHLGYVVDEVLYHPGDSLHVPEQPVETLLVPVHGSWMKTTEAVEFVKAVRPQRSFGIHDGQLNDRGLSSAHGWLAQETGNGYRRLAPGESL